MKRTRVLLLMGILLLAACGGPDEEGAKRPAPLATADARRAVIDSGEPYTPPYPTPTALPRPTCAPEAIWWYEARYREGEQVTIAGPVVEIEPDGALSIGQRANDPNRLRLAPFNGSLPVGRTICATGMLRVVQGLPTLEVSSESELQFLP